MLTVLLLLPLIRAGTLLGAKETVDHENDLKYRNMAKQSVDTLNQQSNDLYIWKLESVDQVQRQTVNGVKYHIQMTVVQTDCTKNQQKKLKYCNPSNKIQKCSAEYVTRAWESYEEVENVRCESPFTKKTKRHIDRLRTRHFARNMHKAENHVKPRDFVSWMSFKDFVERHDKVYERKRDVLKKFRIFKKNLKMIKHYNENEEGTAVYGVTQFADLTRLQFKQIYLPYIWEQPVTPNKIADLEAEGIDLEDELPDKVDWRTKGAVTGVKNQGKCGSCWAFSTTGNIEGQWYLAKNKLVSLAEQQLVDCDSLDQGCSGGLPSNAYKEIIRMGGLEPEDAYPYDAKDEQCHITRKEVAVYINGSVELPQDEVSMQAWLAKKGPISIGINANPLQFYRHGISHPWKILCEPFMLNHGVLIVGYGQDGRKPYWLIKNSWGEKWGESGYYRLYRGKNVCGVREMATSSIVN